MPARCRVRVLKSRASPARVIKFKGLRPGAGRASNSPNSCLCGRCAAVLLARYNSAITNLLLCVHFDFFKCTRLCDRRWCIRRLPRCKSAYAAPPPTAQLPGSLVLRCECQFSLDLHSNKQAGAMCISNKFYCPIPLSSSFWL